MLFIRCSLVILWHVLKHYECGHLGVPQERTASAKYASFSTRRGVTSRFTKFTAVLKQQSFRLKSWNALSWWGFLVVWCPLATAATSKTSTFFDLSGGHCPKLSAVQMLGTSKNMGQVYPQKLKLRILWRFGCWRYLWQLFSIVFHCLKI